MNLPKPRSAAANSLLAARLQAALFAAFVLLASATAPAQEPAAENPEDKWYQIEVIVFEQGGEAALQEEAWDTDPAMPAVEESIALTAPGESPLEGPGPHAFRILPDEARNLTKTHQHLERAADITPILYLAWRQTGMPKAEAPRIQLHVPPRDGEPETPGAREPEQDPSETALPVLGSLKLMEEPPPPPRPVLDGTLRLYVARYLHAEVDLVHHREGVDTPFRLVTSRRMRSGELHYLDHPLFGVLIKVVPFEVKESN